MAFIDETTLILIIFVTVFLTIVAGIILYFMYVYTWTEKRKVFYTKPMEGIPTVFRKRTIPVGKIKRDATIGEHTFPFDMGKPTYRNRNKVFYFVDVDKGQLWIQSKDAPEISPKLLQATIVDELGKQFVSNVDRNPFVGNILMLLIGAIIGVLCGYILGNILPMVV